MATLREAGLPLATIAKQVNFAVPTVCTELKSPQTLAILARIRLKNEDKAAQVYAAVLDSLARRLANADKLSPDAAMKLEEHAVALLERGQPTIAELFPQAQSLVPGANEPQRMTFEELLIGVRRQTVLTPPETQGGQILEAKP